MAANDGLVLDGAFSTDMPATVTCNGGADNLSNYLHTGATQLADSYDFTVDGQVVPTP